MLRKRMVLYSVIFLSLAAGPCFAFEKTSALSDAVRTAENMEPVVPRPAQQAEVIKKTGRLTGKERQTSQCSLACSG
jgi:hypothetical protein